ncbi:MAG: hypothetical protein IPM58_14165 [Nitrospira sp.]|nr:hypothetical protein [Nitrospira sp.]
MSRHHVSRLFLIVVSASLVISLPLASWAQDARCTSRGTPIGALPPAVPIWCLPEGATGSATFHQGGNAWTDDFQHGLSNAPMGNGYREFQLGATTRFAHFRHNDHWMQDVAADRKGGTVLRPERAFQFDNDKLIIETDFAAGVQSYGNGIWGEIVITTAQNPTGERADALYAYDHFPGHYTLGCRLQTDRIIVCSLFDNSARGINQGGRIWEMSFFQKVGQVSEGGGPWGEGATKFRVCNGSDPDVNCRDRFRLELTPTSLELYVNGYRYFAQTGLPALPSALTNRPIYTYFAGVVAGTLPGDQTVRFHWDRIAVGTISTTPPPAPVCRLQRQETNGSWTTIQQPVTCP